jgi:hypothetical protein
MAEPHSAIKATVHHVPKFSSGSALTGNEACTHSLTVLIADQGEFFDPLGFIKLNQLYMLLTSPPGF